MMVPRLFRMWILAFVVASFTSLECLARNYKTKYSKGFATLDISCFIEEDDERAEHEGRSFPCTDILVKNDYATRALTTSRKLQIACIQPLRFFYAIRNQSLEPLQVLRMIALDSNDEPVNLVPDGELIIIPVGNLHLGTQWLDVDFCKWSGQILERSATTRVRGVETGFEYNVESIYKFEIPETLFELEIAQTGRCIIDDETGTLCQDFLNDRLAGETCLAPLVYEFALDNTGQTCNDIVSIVAIDLKTNEVIVVDPLELTEEQSLYFCPGDESVVIPVAVGDQDLCDLAGQEIGLRLEINGGGLTQQGSAIIPLIEPDEATFPPTPVPTSMPSSPPSLRPTKMPSTAPYHRPSQKPSTIPSYHPSSYPTKYPSSSPSVRPSSKPSVHPSSTPTSWPSISPSRAPTSLTCQPSDMIQCQTAMHKLVFNYSARRCNESYNAQSKWDNVRRLLKARGNRKGKGKGSQKYEESPVCIDTNCNIHNDPNPWIIITSADGYETYFEGEVDEGDNFEIVGLFHKEIGSKTKVKIYNNNDPTLRLMQEFIIDTSCSNEPLLVCDTYASLEVVGYSNLVQGPVGEC